MSVKVNKNPNLRSESIFNENKKKKDHAHRKSISLNNLTIITRNKIKIEEPPNKILDFAQFIKQKNKFCIEDTFDVKGTREFLASKEVAMRVIKLNDEIEEPNINKKEYSITQKNLLKIDDMISPKSNKRHKSSKTAGKRTISPRKSRKKSKRMNFEENAIEEKENKKHKKHPQKIKDKNSNNSSYMDSNYESKMEKNNIIGEIKESNISGEDEIYKFFIDHADEPDNDFQKKIQKEIKKFESKKNLKKIKKDNNVRRKSQSKKDFNFKRPKRMNSVIIPKSRESQSQFLFSELNKNKMKQDDINVSSIDESDKACICISPKKANKTKVKRNFGSVQINNKQIKERIYNQFDAKKVKEDHKENNKNENEEGRVEIKSDKDSLISILSDLM